MDDERHARAIVAVPILLCCLGLPILLGTGASSSVITWAGAGALGSVLLAPVVAALAFARPSRLAAGRLLRFCRMRARPETGSPKELTK